jgi:Flp pilus assembly protein TadB
MLDPIVIMTVVGVAGTVVALTFAVWRTLLGSSRTTRFDEALKQMTSAQSDLDTTMAKTSSKGSASWGKFWLVQFRTAGLVVDDERTPGIIAIAASLLSLFFGVFVFPGGFLGVLGAPVAVLGILLWLGIVKSRRRNQLEKQLPLLLSSMRARIQAGTTAQGVLLAIADDLPAPIGDEIRQVRNDVAVAIPLEQSLRSLAGRSQSRLMKFLVSSLLITIESGTDPVPQLIVIEETVRQRARIVGKIRSALALAKPTAYIAGIAPLAMAVWMFITDPSFFPFFFGPGWWMLAIAIALYAAGLFTIRIMVSNVEKV